MLRTHTCNELRPAHIGERVTLTGWIETVRDHGGVLFVDLRDHYGVTQVVFSDDKMLSGIAKETVVLIEGEVTGRDEETVNQKLETGLIEVRAARIEVLGPCVLGLPFEIDASTATREEAATILLRVYNRIHNGISLNYGEVPEGVAEVESYEGMQAFPMSPRAPMEALYRLALTGVTSVYIDGGAWAQNVKNGEVSEGRYLTGAELQDCLVRGKMYRSTRYESSYITCPEEDGSTTVVWFESEADIQKKVQLCRCLGIAELYVKR
jgi:hypothetical protein